MPEVPKGLFSLSSNEGKESYSHSLRNVLLRVVNSQGVESAPSPPPFDVNQTKKQLDQFLYEAVREVSMTSGDDSGDRMRKIGESRLNIHASLKEFQELTSGFNAIQDIFSSFPAHLSSHLKDVQTFIPDDLKEAYSRFCDSLTEKIKGLIQDFQTDGIDYLVDKNGISGKDSIEKLELIFNEMIQGFDQLDKKFQPHTNERLFNGVQSRMATFNTLRGAPPKTGVEDGSYHSIEMDEMETILDMLEGGESPRVLADRILNLAHFNLRHMKEALAGQVLPLLYKEEDVLPEHARAFDLELGTPEKIEFLMHVINRCLRATEITSYQQHFLTEKEGVALQTEEGRVINLSSA